MKDETFLKADIHILTMIEDLIKNINNKGYPDKIKWSSLSNIVTNTRNDLIKTRNEYLKGTNGN